MNQKIVCVLMPAVLLLSGCISGTSTVGYRPNTTLKKTDDVFFECRVEAAKNVPANTITRTSPVRYTPVHTTCTSGYCYSTGGIRYGGYTSSVDKNASLRKEFFRRCLQKKGFTPVTIPQCLPTQVPHGYKVSMSDKLTKPGANACAYKVTDNASQIVNLK
ncbi:hypothetical protein [Hoeflea sp. TYP-13]|uniref:hypothetical protein n=1 Tax=Hoeflea sp. TYP-13 TaxID=3230023 RepID=UPI0034C611BD